MFKKLEETKKNKLKFTDKLLSVISSFTIIFLLCYLALVTIDLNNVWKAINESASIIKKQDKKIRDLQMLFITINKNKEISL
jgi:hypothetical protein